MAAAAVKEDANSRDCQQSFVGANADAIGEGSDLSDWGMGVARVGKPRWWRGEGWTRWGSVPPLRAAQWQA